MADIFHHFLIKAPQQKVFDAVSTPKGLDVWWTKRSSGEPNEIFDGEGSRLSKILTQSKGRSIILKFNYLFNF